MHEHLFNTLPLSAIERIVKYAGVENLVSFLVPENKAILANLPLLKQAIDNAISNSKALGYNNRVTRPTYLHHYFYPQAFIDYDYDNRWILCEPAYHWEHLDAEEKRKSYQFVDSVDDFITLQRYCQEQNISVTLIVSFYFWDTQDVEKFKDFLKLTDKSNRYHIELEFDTMCSAPDGDIEQFDLSEYINPIKDRCATSIVGMELRGIAGEAEINYEDFPNMRYSSFKFSSYLIHLSFLNLEKLKLEYLEIISEDFRPSTDIDLNQLPPTLKHFHATESYFKGKDEGNGNKLQLDHLILYNEQVEILELFSKFLKDGLKTLGLGRHAKSLLSNLETLATVTSLDLDYMENLLNLLKFPNLKKLTIGGIDDTLQLESLNFPQSLKEFHLDYISKKNNQSIVSFFTKLPLGLQKLTLRGQRLIWFPEMLDFSKFEKLKYLSIRGGSENLNEVNFPDSVEYLNFSIASLKSTDGVQFPLSLQFLIMDCGLESICKPKLPSTLKYLHLPGNALREVDLSVNDKNEALKLEVLDLANNKALQEENVKVPSTLRIFNN